MQFILLISIFLTLILPLHSRGAAAPGNYHFKQISIDEGLSQSSVTSITRDLRGNLWIGTRSGLNLFTGNELTTYYHDPADSTSIPSDYINRVVEDDRGNIWVATTAGLAHYDRSRDRFATMAAGNIWAAVALPNGMIFGGRQCLYKYTYSNKSFERLYFPIARSSYDHRDYDVYELFLLDDNSLLLATKEEGIYKYDLVTAEVTPFISDLSNTLLSVHLHSPDSIYVSTFKEGLQLYDSQGVLRQKYTTRNSALNQDIILDIIESDGNIWMATDGGGINILEVCSGEIRSIEHKPGDVNSLPVNSITVLYKDYDENLWAGSVRGGAFLVKEAFVKTYKDVAPGNPGGLSEKAVISLFEDAAGYLWVGTDGGGVNRYDPRTDIFTHYPSTYGDKVLSITDWSDSELLVSLYGKGVFVFNKFNHSYRPFIIVDEQINNRECFSGYAPFCHRISGNRILVLSLSAYIYHTDSGRFEPLITGDPARSLPAALRLVHSDERVSFFVKDNRIFSMDAGDNTIYPVLELEANETVQSVCYDGDETIWIASNRGLSSYDLTRKTLERKQTNLFSRLSAMFLDGDGQLWMNSSYMLFSYSIQQDRFILWGESDGFLPNELFPNYMKPSRSAYNYLGGINGLVRISSDLSHTDTPDPVINLDQISVNGEKHFQPTADGSVGGGTKIAVPWNYTSLAIKVNRKEQDLFRQALYRFTVEGRDTRSTVESYDNTLNLASLSPGLYTVYAWCTTRDGGWSERFRVATLDILPPWYKSSYFHILILAVLLLGSYLTVRYVVQRNERKLRWSMLEHEKELDKEKIDFLINVSHELRTPLTLIYAPVRRMLDGQIDSLEIRTQLESVFRQADHMKNTINLILDSDKLSRNPQALNIEPVELNSWIESAASDFQTELTRKNIALEYRFDDSIGTVYIDVSKSSVIISNMLINALKFSDSGTTVTISTKSEGGYFRISVSDEGIGLRGVDKERLFTRFYQGDHDRKGSGIGLAYSRELAEAQGGKIGAEDNEDKGATFYVELPYTQTAEAAAPIKPDRSPAKPLHPEPVEYDTSGLSLLIVDDNAEFLEFLRGEFASHFLSVYTAYNGDQALKTIRDKMPDMVLSDVMMPRMNGYQLCRAVKEDQSISHIPVVLLTAAGDRQSTVLGYKLGADFYLAKPFEFELLMAVVKNILKGREEIRRRQADSSVPIAPDELAISSGDERFLTRLNSIIKENIADQEFDVKRLTSSIGMSRASLYSKVKAVTGMGVNDYINLHRLELARHLLTHSDMSIAEISDATGFSSQRYFSTVFREATGMSPSKYRSEGRQQ